MSMDAADHRTGRAHEEGLALVIAVMATTLMLALGSALVLLSSSEMAIAANFRGSNEATYAADAILERALIDLRQSTDWTAVLSGLETSSFVDGAPGGVRALTDGSTVDLAEIRNLANCQKKTACSDAEMNAVTNERPWGANNPRWVLYAYGPLGSIPQTAAASSAFYVVALVADDPSENDDDPSRDGASGAGPPNPGAGVVALRAEAFGPRNVHRVMQTIVRRIDRPAAPGEPPSTALRVLSWRDGR